MEWQGGAAGFTKEHIYAGPRRIAEVHIPTGQAAKVTHSHPDPSGSPAMLSDASGLVSAREHYRPYGDKLISPNTNESAGFAGKKFDAATNLSYMSARYYNPTLGRFISPDPVHFVEGNIHSFNRYAYANNNPMRYVDPTGLIAESPVDGFSIAVGAKSFVENIKAGNVGNAVVDAIGIAVDIVALAIPGVPGVAGISIQAGRQAAKGLDGAAIGQAMGWSKGSKAAPNSSTTLADAEKLAGKNVSQQIANLEKQGFTKAEVQALADQLGKAMQNDKKSHNGVLAERQSQLTNVLSNWSGK